MHSDLNDANVRSWILEDRARESPGNVVGYRCWWVGWWRSHLGSGLWITITERRRSNAQVKESFSFLPRTHPPPSSPASSAAAYLRTKSSDFNTRFSAISALTHSAPAAPDLAPPSLRVRDPGPEVFVRSPPSSLRPAAPLLDPRGLAFPAPMWGSPSLNELYFYGAI